MIHKNVTTARPHQFILYIQYNMGCFALTCLFIFLRFSVRKDELKLSVIAGFRNTEAILSTSCNAALGQEDN